MEGLTAAGAAYPGPVRPTLTTLAVLAALLAGCGSDEPDEPGGDERPAARESADELPRLPRGWEPHVNDAAGFALGRPPGWDARERGSVTLLLAPDELVAVTITADRTDEAFELPPDEFARATLASLSGYRDRLEPGRARPFRHRYAASQVTGTAVTERRGVRQRIRVIVLRRRDLAVVTAVIAENAERDARAEARQAVEAVGTVRTRPVG